MTPRQIRNIVKLVSACYPSFGGGSVKTSSNPISAALKDAPAQFAAGVSIESVVRFVLSEAKKIDRERAKRFDTKRWSRHYSQGYYTEAFFIPASWTILSKFRQFDPVPRNTRDSAFLRR